MAGSAGRTARRRRRSRATAGGSATPASPAASPAATPSPSGAPLGPDPRHVQLRRWMRRRGFGRCGLQAAVWPDTGRGLMARRHFQPGDVIISVPERCLLTASTLLDTYLGGYLRECSGSVTALQALCVFLICERFFSQSKICLPLACDGDPALQQQQPQQPGQWGPYIAVLPASYSCPAYFSSEERSALPAPLRQEAEAQVAALLRDWRGTRPLVRLLQSLFPEPVSRVFCKDAFRWAWCSVNTRAVYLPAQPCPTLAGGTGSLALAPILDLLNHHPSAKVTAGFNEATREYEVRAGQTHARHSQVFICYGPHDSQSLLLHYGFVCDANPHDVVYATVDDLLGVVCGPSTAAEWKLTLLQKRDLTRNLTFGVDGPSWRLITAIGILCLPAHKTHLVSDVIVGRGSMQEETQELALRLCCCMEQARRMTIARMSLSLGEPSRLLLQLLTQELCILVSAHSAMQRQQQTVQATTTADTTAQATASTETTADTTTDTAVTADTTAQATATTDTTTETTTETTTDTTTDTTATTDITVHATATTDTTAITDITAQATASTETTTDTTTDTTATTDATAATEATTEATTDTTTDTTATTDITDTIAQATATTDTTTETTTDTTTDTTTEATTDTTATTDTRATTDTTAQATATTETTTEATTDTTATTDKTDTTAQATTTTDTTAQSTEITDTTAATAATATTDTTEKKQPQIQQLNMQQHKRQQEKIHQYK